MGLVRKIFPAGRRRWLMMVLLLAGFVRLFTLGAYPLFDTTEARYAEIARKMVETGDWITPWYDYGVPFWGKPPLSIWATAASIELFGANEFAARLSSFLFALLTVWLVYILAKRRIGHDDSLAAAMVMATTVLFFVAGGGVMTDPALVLGTTASMVSFWLAVKEGGTGSRFWGHMFFLGLAVGLLAKGPLALVLTLFPIGAWTLMKRQWPHVLSRMPWITGTALMVLIALPWYLAAEKATPGFLRYFIIGEHFMRFLKSGWKGDMYGHEHSVPYGSIWLFWLGAAFPWCIVFIAYLLKGTGRVKALIMDEWLSYLFFWAVWPMVFFTLAGNIIWTYVLPGIPAFSILAAELLGHEMQNSEHGKRKWFLPSLGLATPLVFVAFVLFVSPAESVKASQKDVVEGYLKARPSQASLLVYLFRRPYSAQFYSGGRAVDAGSPQKAEPYLKGGANFFVVEKGSLPKLPLLFKSRLEEVGDYGRYELLGEKPYLHTLAPEACHSLT